jgi:cytoskeletal protein CcmA (bactofilin family)
LPRDIQHRFAGEKQYAHAAPWRIFLSAAGKLRDSPLADGLRQEVRASQTEVKRMWKREQPPRSTGVTTSPEPLAQSPSPGRVDQTREEQRPMREEPMNIGKSIVISGELSGSEDLTIEGHVNGKIELRDHVLTIGSNGRITAQVSAKSIIVLGHVTGNLIADEKVDIRESGSVEGDVVAPRVAIADGSHFRGSIDMQRKEPQVPPDATMNGSEPGATVPAAAPDTDELVRV